VPNKGEKPKFCLALKAVGSEVKLQAVILLWVTILFYFISSKVILIFFTLSPYKISRTTLNSSSVVDVSDSHATSMKSTAVWDAASCSLENFTDTSGHPDDGGSNNLLNVGRRLLDYTTQQLRKYFQFQCCPTSHIRTIAILDLLSTESVSILLMSVTEIWTNR
jgi:hypothetical protein